MGKKLSSLALCLVFLLGLMPNVSLLAVEAKGKTPTSVKVGGTEVIDGGYWKTDNGKVISGSEENWEIRYDATTQTLYLHAAHVKCDEIAVYADGNLNIALKGKPSLIGRAGLIVEGNLTLKADAKDRSPSLYVKGVGSLELPDGETCAGLIVSGNLNVMEEFNLHINTDALSIGKHTAMTVGRNLFVSNSTVNATPSTMAAIDCKGNAVVTGKKSRLVGYACGSYRSVGLSVKGNLDVSHGYVEGMINDITHDIKRTKDKQGGQASILARLCL